MSRVFVVQQPTRRGDDGGVEPSFDLSPAEAYGELVFLLHEAHNPFNAMNATAQLVLDAFDEHDYEPEEDYLLLVGNPVLMGVVAAVAGRYSLEGYGESMIRILQWNRARAAYFPVDVQLPHLA
jgi:hypothetical protein